VSKWCEFDFISRLLLLKCNGLTTIYIYVYTLVSHKLRIMTPLDGRLFYELLLQTINQRSQNDQPLLTFFIQLL